MVGEARVASGDCEEEAGEGAACVRARGSVTLARGAAVGDARLLLSRAGTGSSVLSFASAQSQLPSTKRALWPRLVPNFFCKIEIILFSFVFDKYYPNIY